jgi:hypothetical protein
VGILVKARRDGRAAAVVAADPVLVLAGLDGLPDHLAGVGRDAPDALGPPVDGVRGGAAEGDRLGPVAVHRDPGLAEVPGEPVPGGRLQAAVEGGLVRGVVAALAVSALLV